MNKKEVIVVSLGGSLIYPRKLDKEFLDKFKGVIDNSDGRFVIICGGGYLARKYQKIGFFLGSYIRDWLGILASKKNAKIVKKLFDVKSKLISNPTLKIDFKEKILVGNGWKPGWSTDYDAVLLAEQLNAGMVINMSNIDYVYDKDPKKFKDAKKLTKVSWNKFKELVGSEWSPGLNMPFDPIASKKAASLGLKVIIIGKDLGNLRNVLDKKKFKGSVVEN